MASSRTRRASEGAATSSHIQVPKHSDPAPLDTPEPAQTPAGTEQGTPARADPILPSSHQASGAGNPSSHQVNGAGNPSSHQANGAGNGSGEPASMGGQQTHGTNPTSPRQNLSPEVRASTRQTSPTEVRASLHAKIKRQKAKRRSEREPQKKAAKKRKISASPSRRCECENQGTSKRLSEGEQLPSGGPSEGASIATTNEAVSEGESDTSLKRNRSTITNETVLAE